MNLLVLNAGAGTKTLQQVGGGIGQADQEPRDGDRTEAGPEQSRGNKEGVWQVLQQEARLTQPRWEKTARSHGHSSLGAGKMVVSGTQETGESCLEEKDMNFVFLSLR